MVTNTENMIIMSNGNVTWNNRRRNPSHEFEQKL